MSEGPTVSGRGLSLCGSVSVSHSDPKRQMENTDSGSALPTRITTKKLPFQHFSKKRPVFGFLVSLRRQIQDAFKKTKEGGGGTCQGGLVSALAGQQPT